MGCTTSNLNHQQARRGLDEGATTYRVDPYQPLYTGGCGGGSAAERRNRCKGELALKELSPLTSGDDTFSEFERRGHTSPHNPLHPPSKDTVQYSRVFLVDPRTQAALGEPPDTSNHHHHHHYHHHVLKRQDFPLHFGDFHLVLVDELVRSPAGLQAEADGAESRLVDFSQPALNVSPSGGSMVTTASSSSSSSSQMKLVGRHLQPLHHRSPVLSPSSPTLPDPTTRTVVASVSTATTTTTTITTTTGSATARRPRKPAGKVDDTPFASPAHLTHYEVTSCPGLPRRTTFVLLSPSGELLFSTCDGRPSVKVYHVGMGVVVGRLVGHDGPVLGGDVSVDSTQVATVSEDGTAIVWDTATRRMRCSLRHPCSVYRCRFVRSRRELVTGGQDGVCRVWSLHTSQVTCHLRVATAPIISLAIAGDDLHVLAASTGTSVSVWQYTTEDVKVFYGHNSSVRSVEAAAPPPSATSSGSPPPTPTSARGSPLTTSAVRRSKADRACNMAVSVDAATVLIWNVETLEVLRRIDCLSASVSAKAAASADSVGCSPHAWRTACEQPSWIRACFAPAPFRNRVVITSSTQTVYVYDCAQKVRSKSQKGKRKEAPRRNLASSGSNSSASHMEGGSPMSPSDSAFLPAPSTSRTVNSVEEELSLQFRGTVLSVSVGPLGTLAAGDSNGNTYLLHIR